MIASFTLCDRCGDADATAPDRADDWQEFVLPQDPAHNQVWTYHLCPACMQAFGGFLDG